MKVFASPQNNFINFCSNNGYYYSPDVGNGIGTFTQMFRPDLDWERFTDFFVKHFKDKENIQFIQFAASDGSEAYTQIISLLENHKDIEKFFPIKAFDINQDICKQAQSGYLNIHKLDKSRFEEKSIDFNKYFKETDKEMFIKNDTEDSKTYKVSPLLTSKVEFNQGDMFDILRNHEDKSNTIVLCRNVLPYLSDREIDHFTTLCACQLKKGSLIVIGQIDEKINPILQQKGFVRIMPNVYMQP